MKIKTLPIFTTIIFLIIFFVFYKGLKNSNIYVPKTEIEKDIPFFSAQIFGTENQIKSEDIFDNGKFKKLMQLFGNIIIIEYLYVFCSGY